MPDPITVLIPAEPGWTASVTSMRDGDPITCPIVAWAAIGTEVHPVFVAEGSVWTGPEYPVGGAIAVREPRL